MTFLPNTIGKSLCPYLSFSFLFPINTKSPFTSKKQRPFSIKTGTYFFNVDKDIFVLALRSA